MSFSSSCAITLPYSLQEAIPKLGTVHGAEAVARLSPVLTAYEVRELDKVWINDDDLLAGMDSRRELADLEVVLEGEEEGGEGREGHRKVERIAFYIKNEIAVPMFTHIVELTGHGFYDEKVSSLILGDRRSRRAEEADGWYENGKANVELELTHSSSFYSFPPSCAHRILPTPQTQTAVYTSKSFSSPQIGTRWIRKLKAATDSTTLVEEEVTGTCPWALKWVVQRETVKSQKHHMEGYPTLF